jgi:hypothetical protein
MVALVEVAASAEGRLPFTVVTKADITEAVIGATFAVEVAAVVAVVGRFAAATAVFVVLDGNATSTFSDKSIQKLFTSVRVARSARPSTLLRYAIGLVFWMASRRGRNRFVSR